MTSRLIALDLLAGDHVAAKRHFDAYQAAGGRGLTAPGSGPAPDAAKQTVTIPGPQRSFGRMAAISSDSTPDEVLGALARNVVTNGYQASHSNDALEQTEELEPDEDDVPSDRADVPEADALEQSRAVPREDDDRR